MENRINELMCLKVGECLVLRSSTGERLLTLSRGKKGYRFYKGAKSGGVGKKRTRCSEFEARELVKSFPGKNKGE
jgi:hypothetical protein